MPISDLLYPKPNTRLSFRCECTPECNSYLYFLKQVEKILIPNELPKKLDLKEDEQEFFTEHYVPPKV